MPAKTLNKSSALYNERVPTLRFAEARQCVLDQVRAQPAVEQVPLADADTRVLADEIRADRDYPPLARSLRDGFAVRGPGSTAGWRVIGEVRAGDHFTATLEEGDAVEIMTGAPVPAGADSIIMVEHVQRDGDRVRADRDPAPGEFINHRGTEARRNDVLAPRGRRLGFAEIAMAATVGLQTLPVYRQPRVAILPTGDEIVDNGTAPADHQIRNSNAWSLAAQVKRAGGIPHILPVARDTVDHTRTLVEQGLDADLLLLSGGVSAGKYDVVEPVLAALGATFFFDRVKIQPGAPLVFGRARDRFLFGLPGNPGSTMVTFELFARAALERLTGVEEPPLPMALARLSAPFRHKTGLTRFLPAILDGHGQLTPLNSKGSSDVPALARANAFLVADEERESWDAGDLIQVLIK